MTTEYLFALLTYVQIFTTFLMGITVFREGFIIIGLLVFSLGFIISNLIKDRIKRIQERVIDVFILIVFLWIGYSLLNSSFLFEEIIALFMKGALVAEAILSFNSYTRRNLSYMQVLSLFIFVCLPILVGTDNLFYKLYLVVYIFTWLMILRVRVNLVSKNPPPPHLSMCILLFLILAVSLVIASVLKENISLLKVKYTEPIIETKKFDIEEELYQLQDSLYGKFMSYQPKSLEEKSELIQFLTTFFKYSPYVLEMEKARLGLIDFLRRAGPGFRKGDEKEITLLLSKYINIKIKVQNRNIRRDILQELRRVNASVGTKAKLFLGIVELQRQDTAKKVNDIANSLRRTIEGSSLNEEVKKKLKEKIKELKDWKIYELYTQARVILEEEIENIPERYKDLKILISTFFKDIEKTETFAEVSKLDREINESKEILKNISFDETGEIEKRLEEMLMSKVSLMGEVKSEEEVKQIEEIILEENKIRTLSLQPSSLTLALGEKAKFTVTAVYADNSEEDVTSLVEWEVSDPKIINVADGELTSLRRGETTVMAYLENIRSNLSVVTIEEPRIVALGVKPRQRRIKRGDIFSLKATAFYTDKTEKDVTNLVKWHIEDERIVKKGELGQFTAKRSGYTRIYAFYGRIKSPPMEVIVFVPPIEIFRTALITLLAVIVMASLLISIIVKIRAANLRKLINQEPSNFIIEAYNNAKQVLGALGVSQGASTPYLEYARYIEEKFPIEEGIFSRLTYKFFEANYSSHVLTANDAENFASDYNKCMLDVKKKYLVSFRFLSIFLRCYPLII